MAGRTSKSKSPKKVRVGSAQRKILNVVRKNPGIGTKAIAYKVEENRLSRPGETGRRSAGIMKLKTGDVRASVKNMAARGGLKVSGGGRGRPFKVSTPKKRRVKKGG